MSTESPNNQFDVLSPTGPMGIEVSPSASRPATLTGKTIAFVWDYVFRGDDMFPVIQRSLAQQFDCIRFVSHQAIGPMPCVTVIGPTPA